MEKANWQGTVTSAHPLNSVRLEFGGPRWQGAKITVDGEPLRLVRGFTLRYHVAENDGIPIITIEQDLPAPAGDVEGAMEIDEPPAG